MSHTLQTGLLVLHGNRLELLAQALSEWLRREPLAPLETETVLVQSNGMGEWLKMHLAQAHGVCAATSVELPARFVWRAYRAVLGADQVPESSALDKAPLTWRLMGLLPALSREPGFEPLRQFLGPDDEGLRRLQLAQHLADLFDGYQVHRGDWLAQWQQGQDLLAAGLHGAGVAAPVPDAQRWQPELWRQLLRLLSPQERLGARVAVHSRFLSALREVAPSQNVRAFPGLPRRIVLFGTTNLPLQSLEAIAALSAHCQVLMAVPNPCRHDWADTLSGRELLNAQRRRHGLRNGVNLQAVKLEQMHLYGHPLLSAWGRQSRDFIRLLDGFDDAEAARRRFPIPRHDLFDESPPHSLLEQVQAAVRDLLPLNEHPRTTLRDDDRSIVFHVAHGPQREVEVLHDQLLHLLANPPGGSALAPRDIVVMVPDIESFAPAIRSVFGQHARDDARAIPWGIADQKDRGRHPLLLALEWLMRAPQQRFAASQIRALLELPAVLQRLGLEAEDLPLLHRWIEEAGIRWGLDARHRASLGLASQDGPAGERNSWVFGLRRMLLGYATGESSTAASYAGIEPYAEVAGLEARIAGALDRLVRTLLSWWEDSHQPRSPKDWADRLQRLLDQIFLPSDASDRALLQALQASLAAWLQHCEAAAFCEAVNVDVAREAWLGAVDEPGLGQRFRAGGVTFCTLLPMRAIPFEVVCLLGMNDGDYPRRANRGDFDLMALPGQARPGDRSRRDDDRQLMLDALLSARRVLYLSWSGHGLRDPGERPPSVLVEQLRDCLEAVWGRDALNARTTHHPRQPFSRRYFDPEGPLFTYAAEWRDAHTAPQNDPDPDPDPEPGAGTGAIAVAATPPVASVQALALFLRNPVKAFFRQRLQVHLDEPPSGADDDEPLRSQGLARWSWVDELLHACQRPPGPDGGPARTRGAGRAQAVLGFLQQEIDRLARAGRLPLAGPGRQVQQDLLQALRPMVEHWLDVLDQHPRPLPPLALGWTHPHDRTLILEEVVAGLRRKDDSDAPLWVELSASRITSRADSRPGAAAARARPEKLAAAWVRSLVSAACGKPLRGVIIGEDGLAWVHPPEPGPAQDTLGALLQAWREGLSGNAPWPTAMATGLAVVEGDMKRARSAYEGNDFDSAQAEVREPCLSRLYPDFERLSAAEGFEPACQRLYAPFGQWLDECIEVHCWDAAQDIEGPSE